MKWSPAIVINLIVVITWSEQMEWEMESSVILLYLSQDGAQRGPGGRLSRPHYSPDYIVYVYFFHSLWRLGDLRHLWDSLNLPPGQMRTHQLSMAENIRQNYTNIQKRSKAFTHWTHIIIHTNQSRPPQAKSSSVPFWSVWIIKTKSLPSICSVRDTFPKVFPGWISSPMREAQRVESHEYWQDLHLPEKHQEHMHMPKPLYHLRSVTDVSRHGSRGRERLTMQGGELEAIPQIWT